MAARWLVYSISASETWGTTNMQQSSNRVPPHERELACNCANENKPTICLNPIMDLRPSHELDARQPTR
eukprot:14387615-Alexandrium_andersonii.AAC.1